MAVNNYRGGMGRVKRRLVHNQPDIPAHDVPVEQEELVQAQEKSLPILEKYLKIAEDNLRECNPPPRSPRAMIDRQQVWALWSTGISPTRISERLGIPISTVSDHIRHYRNNLEEGLAAIPVISGAELVLHYQNIYHEAIEAWHKSKQNRQRSQLRTVARTRTTSDGPETTDETNSQMTQEGQTGDPRYLERAQVALDRIAVLQNQIVVGSLNQPRQVENATQTMQRAQIYLPHNDRDEPDGEILQNPPGEPLTVPN